MKISGPLVGGLFLIASFLGPVSAIPSGLASRPMTSKIRLLGGALTITMPEGSEVEGRQYNVMGAPEPDEDETRVVLEGGTDKLVLMSYQFQAIGGQDLDKEVDEVLRQWTSETKTKYLKTPATISEGGLSCVFVQEAGAEKGEREANLIESLFVKNVDGTIQYLAVYLNPSACKEWTQLAPLAHAILNSVATGPAQANLGARSVTVDPALGLSVSVPAQVMTSVQEGPDFKVLRCSPLKELGSPAGSLIFYVGCHPNFEPESDAPRIPGNLLGQQVDWRGRKASGSLQSMETLVHVPQREEWVVHSVMTYADENNLAELRKVAESLCISNPNAPAYAPSEVVISLWKAGKYREAIVQCEKVKSEDAKYTDILYVEASCYEELKDFSAGIAIFNKILTLNPDSESALRARAGAYYDSGNYKQALLDCNRLLRRPQEFPELFEFRGDVQRKLKNYQASIADYTSAIDLWNGNHLPCELLVKRAGCHRLLGHYPIAIADCSKAIADLKEVVAYDERARNYDLIGRKDLANSDRFAAQNIRVFTLIYGFPDPPAKRIALPKQFLGAWEIEERYPTIKSEEKFARLAEKLFPKSRSSIWTITGGPQAGYSLSSKPGGWKVRLAIDYLDFMAAYVRFQLVVDGYAVKYRVSLSMQPDYSSIDGLERVKINGQEFGGLYSIRAKRSSQPIPP